MATPKKRTPTKKPQKNPPTPLDYPKIIGAATIPAAVLLLGYYLISHPWLSFGVVLLTTITIVALVIAYVTNAAEGTIGTIASKILRRGK